MQPVKQEEWKNVLYKRVAHFPQFLACHKVYNLSPPWCTLITCNKFKIRNSHKWYHYQQCNLILLHTYRAIFTHFQTGPKVCQSYVAIHVQKNIIRLYVPVITERSEKFKYKVRAALVQIASKLQFYIGYPLMQTHYFDPFFLMNLKLCLQYWSFRLHQIFSSSKLSSAPIIKQNSYTEWYN